MALLSLAFNDGVQATPRIQSVTRSDMTRLSGPAVRAFKSISNEWGLTEAQCLSSLGLPPRSTYYHWLKKAEDRHTLTLPFDTLTRVSGILGIYKSLKILFEDDEHALIWLRSAHNGSLFSGTSPLDFLVNGGADGIMSVRRYLDAWRGGDMGHGAREGEFEPVKEGDLVFS